MEKRGLVQTNVDVLSTAGAVGVSIIERKHSSEGPEQARNAVGKADWRQCRRSVRLPGHMRETAERLCERTKARASRVGSGLPETGDADDDQPRIDRGQRVGAETPRRHRSGPEILDEDIRCRDQLAERFLTCGLLEVERDAPLVPVDDLPPQRLAVLLAPEVAQ
jgi:hypothetical protein